MTPIVWRAEARDDLTAILTYIAGRNLPGAERLQSAIERTGDTLPAHPYMHRPGRIAGSREAIVTPNYIVVYRVTERIGILAALHAWQQYP